MSVVRRWWFDRLDTGAKLILLLSAALLPLGLALAWTARNSHAAAEQAALDLAKRQGLSAATGLDSLIARNVLALRVAASAAAAQRGAEPCQAMARSLALTPAVAQAFTFRGADSGALCSYNLVDPLADGRPVEPGAIALWAAPGQRALYYRVGVSGGMATGRLSVEELARAAHDSEPMVDQLAVRDSSGSLLDIIGGPASGNSDRLRWTFPIAAGRMTVLVETPAHGPGLADRLALLIPLLMFVVAAFGSWLLVKLLLTRPLSRLQRAVNDYRPGEPLVLPAKLGSAEEIRMLGSAFERAVDRIEGSERQMVEALEGQRRLVREVHHRVKNNLQVIASMLSIHGRSAATPESRAAYAAIGRRVDALSVVHRNHFAEVEESQGIPLRPLLVELCATLRGSFADTSSGLVIQLDAEPLHTTQDAAVALSFFVTEIVEYAWLAAPEAPVDIDLHRTSELAATLTVASPALLTPDGNAASRSHEQFQRVVTGLARQLRSPLEAKMGRLSVSLPVFPERH